MARNKAEPTPSPYTLLGAELAPFWSGGSLIGAALFRANPALLGAVAPFGADRLLLQSRFILIGAALAPSLNRSGSS